MYAKYRYIIMTMTVSTVIACNFLIQKNNISCVQPKHNFVVSDNNNLLWSKSDTYFPDNGGSPMIIATSDSVLIAASFSALPGGDLISYDIQSGNMLWQKKTYFPLKLASDQSTFYVAGYEEVLLYDSRTGTLVDEIRLPTVGQIIYFYKVNDKIFAQGNSWMFVIYDTVEKTQTISEREYVRRPFLIEDDVLYISDVDELIAINAINEEVIWKTEIVEGVSNPLFLEDIILLRTGFSIYAGNIYAINKKNGEIIWKKDSATISNIESKGSKVYYLAPDGYLNILDLQSGQEISRLEFTPKPFILSNPGDNFDIGGYYIATSSNGDFVIVSFGDSCQLLAIETSDNN